MFYAERLGGKDKGEEYIAERGLFLTIDEFIPYREKGWSSTEKIDRLTDMRRAQLAENNPALALDLILDAILGVRADGIKVPGSVKLGGVTFHRERVTGNLDEVSEWHDVATIHWNHEEIARDAAKVFGELINEEG